MSDEAEEVVKEKSRVSYPKELREEASMNLKGLATISVKLPDGTRIEAQAAVDLDEAHFVKWCAVLLGRKDVRPLPSFEELIRKTCEEKGIRT